MITLCVEPYCHTCPDFEAEVKKITYMDNTALKTEIKCANCKKCLQMFAYLKTIEKE